MNKNKSDISRVCIVNSVYSLLLYLLISTKEEIQSTFFFFSDGIANSIRSGFPNSAFIKPPVQRGLKSFVDLLRLKIMRLKWPFLKKSVFFGHDHLFFSPVLFGKSKITVIEDGYRNYNFKPEELNGSGFSFALKQRFFGLVNNVFGYGPHCEEIVLSDLARLDALKFKTRVVKPIELWRESSNEKKALILKLYNLSFDELDVVSGKDVVLLTQPLETSDNMSEAEKISLYRQILSDEKPDRVVIKVHPREKTDYGYYFPEYTVFKKAIPIEIFSFLGVRFKTVLSYYSTAALTFPYDIEVKSFQEEFKELVARRG